MANFSKINFSLTFRNCPFVSKNPENGNSTNEISFLHEPTVAITKRYCNCKNAKLGDLAVSKMRITAWWLCWTSLGTWTYESHVMMTSPWRHFVEYDKYMSIRPNSRLKIGTDTYKRAKNAQVETNFKSWNRFEVFGSFLFRKKFKSTRGRSFEKILVRVYWMGKHEFVKGGRSRKGVGCSDLKRPLKVDSDWLVCVWRTLLIGQHRTTSAQDWKFGVTKMSKIHQI